MMVSPTDFEEQALILKALSHPVRLQIVYSLVHQGCHNVGCMEVNIGQSQSSISQHLARLKAAGIVKCQRQGNEVYYEMANAKVESLVAELFHKEEV